MTSALDGIRVLDFGQYIAGPLAAMLLSDQGADVIRIDPPGGPRWDTTANATWNRAKRSVVLDLHTPEDLATARSLVERADVLIENFRPGVMDRLGLGYDAVRTENPQLIYCSLPGFSEDDPRAGTPAWEGVLGAASGTYVNRLARPSRERPAATALPLSSSYGAFLGATSIAAALNARDRDGVGQRIEVPLFDATFTAVGSVGMKLLDRPPPIGRSAMTTPWVNQYECADRRWVQLLANPTAHRTAFVAAAGVESWADDGLLDHARMPVDDAIREELDRRMVALFKTRPAAEWEQLINDAGTPTAICRESSEWLQNEHALASKAVIDLDDPDLGPIRQPGVHPRLDGTPGTVRGPAPRLDADRDSILAESVDPALVRQHPTEPPPSPLAALGALDGVRVLDLCIILAGPTCGRTLAEFGADVIKIDNPNREGGINAHLDINRGKRSVLLDLATEAGKDVFWRLLEDADVVLQNYRAGALDRLGVGYEAVRARKPDIIYASLNAYGHDGPWEHRRGWEHLAQAATGMQMRFGDTRPELQPFPVNDYGTGVLGAYAVALALRHRNITGEGQQVRSALAYTGTLLQSPFMQAFEGKRWDEPRGQDNLGFAPLQRLYQASDGWLFLGAHESQLNAVLAALNLTAPGDNLEATLESALATTTVDAAIDRLLAAGVGAHAVLDVQTNMESDWLTSRGISITREHDGPGRVRTTGPSPRLSRTPVRPGAPASAPGSDGPAVLEEHGFTAALPDLLASRVLVESL